MRQKKAKIKKQKQHLGYYQVEDIVSSRTLADGTKQYLVKWLGYNSQDNTWETETNLSTVNDMIHDFENKQSKETNCQKNVFCAITFEGIDPESRPVEGFIANLSQDSIFPQSHVSNEQQDLRYNKLNIPLDVNPQEMCGFFYFNENSSQKIIQANQIILQKNQNQKTNKIKIKRQLEKGQKVQKQYLIRKREKKYKQKNID